MKRNAVTNRQVGGDHYRRLAIQPVEFIERNGLGFLEGNVIKYVVRHAAKGGAEDLDKAMHYLALLREYRYGASTPPASAPGRRTRHSGAPPA